MKSKAEVSSS